MKYLGNRVFYYQIVGMAISPGKRLTPIDQIPNPNSYILALRSEYKKWVFEDQTAVSFRGNWRESVFQVNPTTALDLEIGVGNGFFFSDYASRNSDRLLVGLEIKFKPLIQTARRALGTGATNIRLVRFHAGQIANLFAPDEVNHVFLYFPDPWPKIRTHKHRLIQIDFLTTLHQLQRSGSYFEFKTDSADYFDWGLNLLKQSPYRISRVTNDLHRSEWAEENFQTHFEKLWTKKGLKTHLVRAEK